MKTNTIVELMFVGLLGYVVYLILSKSSSTTAGSPYGLPGGYGGSQTDATLQFPGE